MISTELLIITIYYVHLVSLKNPKNRVQWAISPPRFIVFQNSFVQSCTIQIRKQKFCTLIAWLIQINNLFSLLRLKLSIKLLNVVQR